MNLSVGSVIAGAFGAIKERLGALVAMWLLYFVLTIVGMIFFGIVFAGIGMAGLSMASGFDPAGSGALGALGALGGGMIASILLFYVAYIFMLMAQMGSLTALASAYSKPTFGEAFKQGISAAFPLLGASLLLLIVYFIVGIPLGLALNFAGDIAGVIAAILFLPVLIYLGCRLMLMVPVAVTESVRNPVKIIARSWELSRGHVFKIFLILLVMIVIMVVSLGLVALPFLTSDMTGTAPGGGTVFFVLIAVLAVFFFITVFQAAVVAATHSALSPSTGEDYDEIFQ